MRKKRFVHDLCYYSIFLLFVCILCITSESSFVSTHRKDHTKINRKEVNYLILVFNAFWFKISTFNELSAHYYNANSHWIFNSNINWYYLSWLSIFGLFTDKMKTVAFSLLVLICRRSLNRWEFHGKFHDNFHIRNTRIVNWKV